MIRCGLIGEGSSDRCPTHPLQWLLAQLTEAELALTWIELGQVRTHGTLRGKVEAAGRLARVDLLFIHRDADGTGGAPRYDEISAAAQGAPHVAVVPVRMTEAWLLLDEGAIRHAAGAPAGRAPLNLPGPRRLEALADPKETLHTAILEASGLTGRRRDKLNVSRAAHDVARLTDDWSPLRQLPAFSRLEQDTRRALAALGLPLSPA